MAVGYNIFKMRLYVTILCAMFMTTTTVVMAQQRTLPSREALDSLVNPPLSTIACGAISVEPESIHINDISDDAPVNILFTLKNTTAEAITITNIRTSCSCLKVISAVEHLDAGASAKLRAEFNSKGRNGDFAMRLLVYTNLDDRQPTARLDIDGSVVASDVWSHLPESIGGLRLSRKSVVIDGTKPGITRTERIAIANSGARELRLTAHSTTPGITFSTEPEILAPGAEGDMIISYTPQEELVRDIETMLIIEGCEARPTDRVIRITIKR